MKTLWKWWVAFAARCKDEADYDLALLVSWGKLVTFGAERSVPAWLVPVAVAWVWVRSVDLTTSYFGPVQVCEYWGCEHKGGAEGRTDICLRCRHYF